MPPAGGRPTCVRKAPGWMKDYELSEMSICQEIRRPTSVMVEDVGVGGMLDYDIPSTAHSESRLREAMPGLAQIETSTCNGTGLENPATSDSRETKTTCVRSVLIGMRNLCRKNGLSEVFTTYLVGRMALELCYSDPPI